jgi:hypothetical protein
VGCWGVEACKRKNSVVTEEGAALTLRFRTGICAAIKTTKLLGLTARSDLTWETYSLFMWTG